MQRKTGVATEEERVSLFVRKAMLQLEDGEEMPEVRGIVTCIHSKWEGLEKQSMKEDKGSASEREVSLG